MIIIHPEALIATYQIPNSDHQISARQNDHYSVFMVGFKGQKSEFHSIENITNHGRRHRNIFWNCNGNMLLHPLCHHFEEHGLCGPLVQIINPFVTLNRLPQILCLNHIYIKVGGNWKKIPACIKLHVDVTIPSCIDLFLHHEDSNSHSRIISNVPRSRVLQGKSHSFQLCTICQFI